MSEVSRCDASSVFPHLTSHTSPLVSLHHLAFPHSKILFLLQHICYIIRQARDVRQIYLSKRSHVFRINNEDMFFLFTRCCPIKHEKITTKAILDPKLQLGKMRNIQVVESHTSSMYPSLSPSLSLSPPPSLSLSPSLSSLS